MTKATAKAKPKTPNTANKSDTLAIVNKQGKSKERQFAEIGQDTAILNALTARTYTQKSMGEIDITEAVSVMRDKVSKVNTGDTSELEATLTAQAVSLDAIFNELARRAALNMGEYMQATETYMRLALKAQAQCARTIEVMATMKNPPVIFAKQANISSGNQQVNNGSVNNGQPPTHAGKIINQPNELLSEANNATLDTRGTATTIGTDKAMATLETQHRR